MPVLLVLLLLKLKPNIDTIGKCQSHELPAAMYVGDTMHKMWKIAKMVVCLYKTFRRYVNEWEKVEVLNVEHSSQFEALINCCVKM